MFTKSLMNGLFYRCLILNFAFFGIAQCLPHSASANLIEDLYLSEDARMWLENHPLTAKKLKQIAPALKNAGFIIEVRSSMLTPKESVLKIEAVNPLQLDTNKTIVWKNIPPESEQENAQYKYTGMELHLSEQPITIAVPIHFNPIEDATTFVIPMQKLSHGLAAKLRVDSDHLNETLWTRARIQLPSHRVQPKNESDVYFADVFFQTILKALAPHEDVYSYQKLTIRTAMTYNPETPAVILEEEDRHLLPPTPCEMVAKKSRLADLKSNPSSAQENKNK
jgi:hypothetical protein